MPRQIIDPESGDKKFDALVHVRNRQGQIAEERHYECIFRNGVQVFKDKKGFYYADGSDVPMKHLLELGLVKAQAEASKPALRGPAITAARTIPTPAPAPAPAPEPAKPGLIGRLFGQHDAQGNPDQPDQGPPNAEQEPQPEGGEDEDPNPEPPASDDQGPTGL